MCRILNISRSGYYKYQEPETKKDEYAELVCKIFKENQEPTVQDVLKKNVKDKA